MLYLGRQRADDIDAVDVQELVICWNPSSTSPLATIGPTVVPGGTWRDFAFISAAIPMRSKRAAR